MKKPMRPILILLAAFVAPAAAQTTFGSITGTVKDQSGAVAPGVQITGINQDTGVSRRAPTGSDGVYTVTDLLPGTYRLQAEQKRIQSLQLQSSKRRYQRPRHSKCNNRNASQPFHPEDPL